MIEYQVADLCLHIIHRQGLYGQFTRFWYLSHMRKSLQQLNAHADVSSVVDLNFGLSLLLLPYFGRERNETSDKIARMHRLI